MLRTLSCIAALALLISCAAAQPAAEKAEQPLNQPPEGFVALFNGKDFTNWTLPEGDGGHWKVIDGVIDYDAMSEAPGDKNVWSEKEYGDFVLRLDWRLKETHGLYPMNLILPDGSNQKDAYGKDIVVPSPNADSGVYVRGTSKAQINIWCWPVGSGEVWGYRRDMSMPPEVRAGATPKVKADRPVGEWNTFEITMRGDRMTVLLNGFTVLENAQLPDVPERGRLALQHHGGMGRDGQMSSSSSLVQFRNIFIREL